MSPDFRPIATRGFQTPSKIKLFPSLEKSIAADVKRTPQIHQ